MKKKFFAGLVLAGTLAASVLVSLPAAAAPDTAAADPAWEKFASARRVFQIRLAELAARRWPEYTGFFTAHRNLQLAYIERRNVVFYYLKEHDPARIVRDHGGEAFLSFSWKPEEEKIFAKEIPGYEALTGEIAALKAKTDRFKYRDVLKDRFSRLEIDPEYLALMRDMSRSIGEGERTLAKAAASLRPKEK